MRCPNGVEWCINTRHTDPDVPHLADLEFLDANLGGVGVTLWRPTTETDPAKSWVRIHYGPDHQDVPNSIDLPPGIAADLAEVIGSLSIHDIKEFAAALAKGKALLDRELGR